MSTHNICFRGEITKKYYVDTLSSEAVTSKIVAMFGILLLSMITVQSSRNGNNCGSSDFFFFLGHFTPKFS